MEPGSRLNVPAKKMTAARAMTNTTSVRYSRRRKARAPSWIAAAISRMRSVPASMPLTRLNSQKATSSASAPAPRPKYAPEAVTSIGVSSPSSHPEADHDGKQHKEHSQNCGGFLQNPVDAPRLIEKHLCAAADGPQALPFAALHEHHGNERDGHEHLEDHQEDAQAATSPLQAVHTAFILAHACSNLQPPARRGRGSGPQPPAPPRSGAAGCTWPPGRSGWARRS